MHLHVVEQAIVAQPAVKEDPFKPEYLANLDPVDRCNLEQVITTLISNLPLGTRILAIGSATSKTNGKPVSYRDIDLQVVGNEETIPKLGQLVYPTLRGMSGYKVSRHLAGRYLNKLQYLARNVLPSTFELGRFVARPEKGKPIEIFISPLPHYEHFERFPLFYISLT